MKDFWDILKPSCVQSGVVNVSSNLKSERPKIGNLRILV